MAESDVDDGLQEDFTLDCLPIDCIVYVCEYLEPKDLARFSLVCKLFYEASLTGHLWRRHCLSRWTFCDVLQIPVGPGRWRRYYLARGKVEDRLDRGRPKQDYRVKTLRGHESDITNAVCIGRAHVDWENPAPPLVVSLSGDGSVKAWDVLQGKPLWSLDDGTVSALAADEGVMELATGGKDGSITLWSIQEWSVKLHLPQGGQVVSLQYGRVKNSKLPSPFIMAYVNDTYLGGGSRINLWDPANATKPFFILWAPPCNGNLHLSTGGLLALKTDTDAVHVWDLTILTPSDKTSISPHATINCYSVVDACTWLSHGCLATHSIHSINIDIWDVGSHLERVRRSAGRSLYSSTNMLNPVRTVSNESPPVCMQHSNGMLVTGDRDGTVRVLHPRDGACLQGFTNHKGPVTDLYADSFRVLSCSRDFSIRVYQWLKKPDASLESRYTLLGGSVVHKTHDGFRQILCTASCCVGVCGNQLKFYTFAFKLDT